MFLDERLEKILEILENEKKVKVTDLAEKFNVSEVIIRKNLKRLEQEGKIEKNSWRCDFTKGTGTFKYSWGKNYK